MKCVSSLLEQTGRVLLPDALENTAKKGIKTAAERLRVSRAAKLFL